MIATSRKQESLFEVVWTVLSYESPYLLRSDLRIISSHTASLWLTSCLPPSHLTEPLFYGVPETLFCSFFLPEMPSLFNAIRREFGFRLLLKLCSPFL